MIAFSTRSGVLSRARALAAMAAGFLSFGFGDPPPGEILEVKTVQSNGEVLFSLPDGIEPKDVRLIDAVVNELGDGTDAIQTVWRIEGHGSSNRQATTISWPIKYAESVAGFDILIGPFLLKPGRYLFNADVEVSSRSPNEKRRLLILQSSFTLTDEMKLK